MLYSVIWSSLLDFTSRVYNLEYVLVEDVSEEALKIYRKN